MTTRIERWLLDTNVWVFGLRRDEDFPDCFAICEQIGAFHVVVPLQVLKELNLNLTDEEMQDFYWLINQHPEWTELSWQAALLARVKFYEDRGCRKGDAVIAAHAETLRADLIVTNNRQFLQTVTDRQVRMLTPRDALARLSSK